MSLFDRVKRVLHVLPEDVEPSQDVGALATFVRFPVTPSGVHWRGRRQSSSGRIGGRWYLVEVLARFDNFAPIARALEALPIYPRGCGFIGASEVFPAEVMPLIAGPTHTRGKNRVAKSWWAHPGWRIGASFWVCPLGDGPYLIGAFSTESISFGIAF